MANNTVNGRPLVYLEDVANYNVSNAGQVVLVRCNNITVQNLTLSNATIGMELVETNNSIISGNTITANSIYGIWLEYSYDNSIRGNSIIANELGMWFIYSDYNNIIGNDIRNNSLGLEIYSSSNNEICLNNPSQVFIDSSGSEPINTWDNGYPSGGNYWSDYHGTDVFNGPNQNLTGSDGIGDTPYVIDVNNTDHYPLMQAWTGPALTSTYVTLSVNLVTVGSAVTCTATVSAVNAPTRASGTVTWSTGSSTGNFNTSVCSLSSGNCSTTYVDSCPGSVTIAAWYSGDSNYLPSSAIVILTVISSGPVYYSKNYSSVQAAIDAATNGSNVIVAAGTYHECLVVNKTLTILGEKDDRCVQRGSVRNMCYVVVWSVGLYHHGNRDNKLRCWHTRRQRQQLQSLQ